MTQIHVIGNECCYINVPVLVTDSSHFDDNQSCDDEVKGVAKDVEIHDVKFFKALSNSPK